MNYASGEAAFGGKKSLRPKPSSSANSTKSAAFAFECWGKIAAHPHAEAHWPIPCPPPLTKCFG